MAGKPRDANIVVLGDDQVGKTVLIRRVKHDSVELHCVGFTYIY